ncbi:unnamed protein product [Rotaria socialis]|uniref:Uncharacterized protein n=1 Tax=Rotaria socialis TaxID=392032 RepID=A0A817XF25_9BILA|nr:unnamed protein product [Rotaria socialis]
MIVVSSNRDVQKENCRGRIDLYNSFLFSSTIDRTDITLVSSHSHAPEPAQLQRSIQRKRQQQKSFDAFLMTIEHEEHLSSSDIEILYHSINDNSSLHLTDISI